MNNIAFQALITKFGKKPKSHLGPLWNYFFVPQTTSQLKSWKRSIKEGVRNQNLLLFIEDFDLIKAFSPSTTMNLTKSGRMCRISLDTFVADVEAHILSKLNI